MMAFFIQGKGYPEGYTVPHSNVKQEERQVWQKLSEHLDPNTRKVIFDPELAREELRHDENDRFDNRFFGEFALSDKNIESQLENESDEVLLANMLDLRRSLMAVETTLETGEPAYNLSGGHHHAQRGQSSAPDFNRVNDISGIINYSRKVQDLNNILIVDLDLHHGDGTVADFRQDPETAVFSLHQWDNFPKYDSGWKHYNGAGEGKGTIHNFPLPNEISGELYNDFLADKLPEMIEITEPELVVYQAGRDVHHEDELGDLNLDLNDMFERDRIVMENVDSPLVVLGGGGYGPKAEEAAVNTYGSLIGEQIYTEDAGFGVTEKQEEDMERWYGELDFI